MLKQVNLAELVSQLTCMSFTHTSDHKQSTQFSPYTVLMKQGGGKKNKQNKQKKETAAC